MNLRFILERDLAVLSVASSALKSRRQREGILNRDSKRARGSGDTGESQGHVRLTTHRIQKCDKRGWGVSDWPGTWKSVWMGDAMTPVGGNDRWEGSRCPGLAAPSPLDGPGCSWPAVAAWHDGLSRDRVTVLLQKKRARVIVSRHLCLSGPCTTPALIFVITPSVGRDGVGDRDDGTGRCPSCPVCWPAGYPPHLSPLLLALC